MLILSKVKLCRFPLECLNRAVCVIMLCYTTRGFFFKLFSLTYVTFLLIIFFILVLKFVINCLLLLGVNAMFIFGLFNSYYFSHFISSIQLSYSYVIFMTQISFVFRVFVVSHHYSLGNSIKILYIYLNSPGCC